MTTTKYLFNLEVGLEVADDRRFVSNVLVIILKLIHTIVSAYTVKAISIFSYYGLLMIIGSKRGLYFTEIVSITDKAGLL